MCKRSVRQNFSVYFQVVGKVIKGPGGEWAARSHAWMNKRRVVLQTMRWSRSGRPVAESVLQWTAECPEGVTLSEFGVPFLTFFWNHRIFFSGVQISWVDDRLDRIAQFWFQMMHIFEPHLCSTIHSSIWDRLYETPDSTRTHGSTITFCKKQHSKSSKNSEKLESNHHPTGVFPLQRNTERNWKENSGLLLHLG